MIAVGTDAALRHQAALLRMLAALDSLVDETHATQARWRADMPHLFEPRPCRAGDVSPSTAMHA